MATFDNLALSDLCIAIQVAPTEVCVLFPGGAELCASAGIELGDPAAIARGLLAQVNTGMMPLQPIFAIVNALKAAADCMQAVPDIVGPPPDPTGLEKAIPKLLEAIDKLLGLLPSFSVPPLVKSLLSALILFLRGMELELKAIAAQMARIADAMNAAAEPGNAELLAVVSCEKGNLDAQLQNLNASVAPLNNLIGIVNPLLKLVGIELLPMLDAPGIDPEAALGPLDDTIQVLTAVRAAIPGPG